MARRLVVPVARIIRLVAGPVAVVYAIGALHVARESGQLSTYAGRSGVLATLAVASGLGLVAAGVVLTSSRSFAREGWIALLAGFAWFAPLWVGWEGGPSSVRAVGMLIAGFVFPLLAHLVAASPYGRLESVAARVIVGALYAEASLSALGRALFRDPYLDPNCWDNCTSNAFLIHESARLADGIRIFDAWFAAGGAVTLAALCVVRLATVTAPARRVLWPVLTAGIGVAGATVAHSVAVYRTPLENPGQAIFETVFIAGCTAVIGLALGLIWPVARVYRQRLAVARIVAEIADAPGPATLETALATALGDPEIQIAYWLPTSGRYGDAHGRPVEDPLLREGKTITPLARDGAPIAVVAHAGSSADLEREIGATVRLALDNERLHAEVLAQLEDLRTSRTRIIETGDAARRRLERDLHDGAQQHLLALSYDIRLAQTAAASEGDSKTAAALADAVETTHAALGELRELAHGIHPAILTEAGLAPALATLAESAPLPMELDDTTLGRYRASVETAAYTTVVEALADAAGRGASHVVVTTIGDEQRLLVEVVDDGTTRTEDMIRLNDRIGALDGRLEVLPQALRAEIPCG